MKPARFFATAVLLSSVLAGSSQEYNRIFEAFPPDIQVKLERRDRFLKEAVASNSGAQPLFYIVNVTKRWVPGQDITVAFRGGDSNLRKMISEAASEWT